MHESIDGFEPDVARPNVAAVLLAIRWCSHSYGDVQDFWMCRTFCEKHGKPLVRLPGELNPNPGGIADPRTMQRGPGA